MHQENQRKLAAIVFMDIVGYTSMVEKSEKRALEFVKIHKEELEQLSRIHNGQVINYYGDASLTMFDSAIEAVKCATEIQLKFRNHYDLPMRIGVHLGEVVINNESIFGHGVNVASRLESMGVPGSVLVSEAVKKELRNQEGITTEYIGKYKFKNVTDKMDVFSISNPGLVVPQSKDLKSEKSVNTIGFNLTNALIGAAIILFLFVAKNYPFKAENNEVLQERLSVPSFKNFTGDHTLDFIGEMIAHRITKEIFEIDGTSVVNYQTKAEVNQIKYASILDSEIAFAKLSGAINIIEGNIQKVTNDSLVISAIIKNLNTGEVLKSFKEIIFPVNDPIVGVKALSEYVRGYWHAKDSDIQSIPKLEAYKLFLEAKNN